MTARHNVWIGTALLLTGLAGCKSTNNNSPPGNAGTAGGAAVTAEIGGGTAAEMPPGTMAGSGAAATADAGLEDAVVYCPDGSIDATNLVVGWEAKGKMMSAKLVSTAPNPPERYMNQWVVDFVDAAGNPVQDVTVKSSQTWMPYHGHGWPGMATQMTPGRFKFNLNFQMKGYFQIKMDVSSASLGSEEIMYAYCLR